MREHRSGITLIETLVVIGIIGLLLTILIPAVQYARESARRSACQNNLRQQAIAIQVHESAHRSLPSLYYGTFLKQPRYALDEFHFHSWRTAILPELEQGALYQQIDLSLPASDVANQTNLNIVLPVFICPSTSNPTPTVPDVREINDGAYAVTIVGTAARSDYEAIGGVYAPHTPRIQIRTDLRDIGFGVWGEPEYNVTTGAPIRYRVTRFADATDGLSNTMMIGERAGVPDSYNRGKPVYPYPALDPFGRDNHQAAWGISTHIWWLVFSHDQSINDTNATGMYSFHSSGANVALADGSVRFLSEQTDVKTLQALTTRSQGDVVNWD